MKRITRLVAMIGVLAMMMPGCSSVRDIDGNRYRTMKINGMRWMAENLRTTRYADGSQIPQGSGTDQDTLTACYFDYKHNPDSVNRYGILYTWTAAMRNIGASSAKVQGVCPDGWHLPDNTEWEAMTKGCASEKITRQAPPTSPKSMRKIKRFVRTPRGGYHYPNDYIEVGNESYWWSSTPSDDGFATGRYLDNFSYPCPYVSFGKTYNGYSVRCVKD